MADMTQTPTNALTVEFGTRPEPPKIPNVTAAQRERGRGLATIHAHYLQDMTRIAQVIDRIEAGDTPPDDLAHIVLASDMAQNFRAFGNLCGQGCQMLMMHHNIEETHMFPEIAEKAALFAPLVARLRAEHEVVHELLNRLANCAQRLANAPNENGFAETRSTFDALHRAIQSHFRYEETSLEDVIGVHVDRL